MEDIEAAVQGSVTGLDSVQKIQQSYDEVGWRMSSPEFRKFRHIAIHLSKYVGQLCDLTEQWEHSAYDAGLGEDGVVINEKAEEIEVIVGALVYHAAQLSTLIGKPMSECYLERVSTNAARFAPDTVFAKLSEITRRSAFH